MWKGTTGSHSNSLCTERLKIYKGHSTNNSPQLQNWFPFNDFCCGFWFNIYCHNTLQLDCTVSFGANSIFEMWDHYEESFIDCYHNKTYCEAVDKHKSTLRSQLLMYRHNINRPKPFEYIQAGYVKKTLRWYWLHTIIHSLVLYSQQEDTKGSKIFLLRSENKWRKTWSICSRTKWALYDFVSYCNSGRQKWDRCGKLVTGNCL